MNVDCHAGYPFRAVANDTVKLTAGRALHGLEAFILVVQKCTQESLAACVAPLPDVDRVRLGERHHDHPERHPHPVRDRAHVDGHVDRAAIGAGWRGWKAEKRRRTDFVPPGQVPFMVDSPSAISEDRLGNHPVYPPVSYTHLTLPTNREV